MRMQYLVLGLLMAGLVALGGCERRAPKAPAPVKGGGGEAAWATQPSESMVPEKQEPKTDIAWCAGEMKRLTEASRGAQKITVWIPGKVTADLTAQEKEELIRLFSMIKPEVMAGPVMLRDESVRNAPVADICVNVLDANEATLYRVLIYDWSQLGGEHKDKPAHGHVYGRDEKGILVLKEGLAEVVANLRGLEKRTLEVPNE